MQKKSQTNFFKLSIVIAVFGLLIFLNPQGFFAPLRRTAVFVATPFQKVLYFASLKTMAAREFVFSVGQLKADNEELVRRNQELLTENARLKDAEKENIFLREQLEFLPREKFELLAANVVSQDPHGPGNWLEIDKGSADGLTEGMAVIISKGILLGRLQEVSTHSAQVSLLTNPKSAVNGVVSETGAKGIVKGEYGLGILYDMVLQSDALRAGDEVITSGIGSNLPRGLYVGKVQEVHSSDDQLFQQATIVSPIKTSALQFVFVLKGNK